MTAVSFLPANQQPAVTPHTEKEKTAIDYNAFLKLFIAQLKNQDPMNPRDPSESLSQLASFSSVEQSIKLNEKIDQLIAATNTTVSAAMIGRTVSDLGGTISGIVTSIESTASGLTAVLETGKELPLNKGYRISHHE
jgi:flagellar basal-body rod modification protein FlgD